MLFSEGDKHGVGSRMREIWNADKRNKDVDEFRSDQCINSKFVYFLSNSDSDIESQFEYFKQLGSTAAYLGGYTEEYVWRKCHHRGIDFFSQ